MKKLLAFLLFALAASCTFGQANGGGATPMFDAAGKMDGTSLLGYINVTANGGTNNYLLNLNLQNGSNMTITCTPNLSTQTLNCSFASAGGGGTTVATDPIWTAAGQLVVGTGSATAHVIGSGTGLLHQAGAADPTWSTVVNADIAAATIDLTTKVTGILPSANGGTGMAFFTVAGPASSAKTFTFPNASANVLTDNALVTAAQGGTANGFFAVAGPASSTKTFTFPNASANVLTDNALVTAAQGGTANGFFAVAGPASSTKTYTFPNASTTVLTTNAAVTVAQGGTGLATLTAHGVILGEGASNVNISAAGTAGQAFTSGGASADGAFSTTTTSPLDITSTIFFQDDFFGNRSSATSSCGNSGIWTVTNTNSATGTATSQNVGADSNHQGNCEYDTGTANAAAATSLDAGSTSGFYFTGNEVWSSAVWLTALSGSHAGDTYVQRIGVCNVTTGAVCTHGAWFEYTDTVNSGQWTINTGDSGGTTTQNTTTAPTSAAWHNYKITTNAAATQFHFFIDGVEVANSPNTTHLPVASTAAANYGHFAMTKTLGTGQSYGFVVDFAQMYKTGISR